MTPKAFYSFGKKPWKKRLREQFGLLSIKLDLRSESLLRTFCAQKAL
jgi:hypothetical protein